MKTPVSPAAAVLANIKVLRARSNVRRAANSMQEPNSSGGISMKPVIRSTLVAAALAFAFGGPAVAANEVDEHDHAGHDGVQYAKLDLNAADAQLHKLIGRIMSGTETLQSKEPGVARRTGAERIAEALGEYARQFDHPGWF